MARIARVVAPGIPHHVTQRGNRSQQTFFKDADYQFYIESMAEWCDRYQVDIWAYSLMPNHVHLIAVPETKDGLNFAISQAHQRYSRRINLRKGWRGHLWQGRFASFIMDERYLLACARYIELNPVQAGLVINPEDWHWSSARPHIEGEDDKLVKSKPLLEFVREPWKEFLQREVPDHDQNLFRKHERSGRPLGEDSFIVEMESLLGRKLKTQKRGPKFKNN